MRYKKRGHSLLLPARFELFVLLQERAHDFLLLQDDDFAPCRRRFTVHLPPFSSLGPAFFPEDAFGTVLPAFPVFPAFPEDAFGTVLPAFPEDAFGTVLPAFPAFPDVPFVDVELHCAPEEVDESCLDDFDPMRLL